MAFWANLVDGLEFLSFTLPVKIQAGLVYYQLFANDRFCSD